ncbi:Putative phytochrome, signal transduction response regulator, receiver domain, GAF [Septoria linicola]|uniref:Phytochrome, signal transduction response regulator, receiver domain, GAF n=1 Tax=Septoria linicola TaxID=215465 RepID=A0A9Q9AJE3_9PEZI|nr:Putative phytochrome, signal transduction response regulator, receiver domain, GAF [Septoria linicola]
MSTHEDEPRGNEAEHISPPPDNSPRRNNKPLRLSMDEHLSRAGDGHADGSRSPTTSMQGQLSPAATDRVFPIRSVVSVDPAPPTPMTKSDKAEGYFQSAAQARRMSSNAGAEPTSNAALAARGRTPTHERKSPWRTGPDSTPSSRQASTSTTGGSQEPTTHSQQVLNDIMTDTDSIGSEPKATTISERASVPQGSSIKSTQAALDDTGPLVTARFKHVVTDGGHAIITGRDGETLQRCEDEPIHIPGAIQGFGLLIALEEQQEGKLVVRVVSENSKRLLGFTPQQLFALDSFTDILSEEQADNLLDHVDFIRDEDADVITNGPEVFTISVRNPQRKSQKFWCAMHINDMNPNLVICEFELEDDPVNPLVPPNDMTPEPPEDTLDSRPTAEEYLESTQNNSKPLRVLRSARKRKGEAAAMEVFNIMSQVQEQLAAAPNLEKFLKILVGVVKELTGFHRVMVYQFDQNWNGRVVTELVDPRATKDLYKGLNFPASDIPKQARELYKINKVRMLYDRDQETARLVCRTMEDLETPIDLTYSYLRAMSPIHLKYLGNMAVRSSMSISINAFEELWGLIACHSYGGKGMRVSFPIRKMCRLVGDSASRNIERLSYASRLQARKLINTVPTQANPSGYIIASSEDLLKLFDADFGLLSIRDETKILGHLEQTQEALAMLEYLRMRCITNVMTSQDIKQDFPDLRYPPGFKEIAGVLLVPLSVGGQDFIVFFRKGQLKEVKWAGNPYEKFVKEGTEGYLEPRKSFRTWSETVVGKCREWSEEEIETAAVLCLVYGKFIEVWRQKEAALQNSQLTRLLLANSAHEVRTPLNAIINYLEIALEGTLDQETRENLAKSHSASKSLIYVINDLLDLTKTEEGGELVKDEVFDLQATLYEATDMFKGDARRKNITYEVVDRQGLPQQVLGDQRRIRQAISNVAANAIQNTTEGGVKVEMYVASREDRHVDVEVSVADTGIGMNAKKLDALFRELEQVQTETDNMLAEPVITEKALPEPGKPAEGRTLGLGLAVVARIVRNMNGQLRLKSEEGRGSRFVVQFPFEIPESGPKEQSLEAAGSQGSVTPYAEQPSDSSTPPIPEDMMTLIDRSASAGVVRSPPGMPRKNSAESFGSKRSLSSYRSGGSYLSKSSAHSAKSEADRLIEAIQEPHRVDGWHENSVERSNTRGGSGSSKLRVENRPATSSAIDQTGTPTKTRARSLDGGILTEQLLEHKAGRIGQRDVTDSGVPIRPVRVLDDFVASPTSNRSPEPKPQPQHQVDGRQASSSPQPATDAQHLKVLVAEDDPVNSRIIKKRMERLGHEVTLTVNGEECASTYCDQAGFFDIVLMDMQMPIVDGLTSAKMIRSFEKSHPKQVLSTRAAMNGRVPIIAVSASLIERERQIYIDGGFDGWILKPISFNRLSEIMEGIVDRQVRKENLYQPGTWERGGWFDVAQKDLYAADTAPNSMPPQTVPTQGVKVAAAIDDPQVKEEESSMQTHEQIRLAEAQKAELADSVDSTQRTDGG